MRAMLAYAHEQPCVIACLVGCLGFGFGFAIILYSWRDARRGE